MKFKEKLFEEYWKPRHHFDLNEQDIKEAFEGGFEKARELSVRTFDRWIEETCSCTHADSLRYEQCVIENLGEDEV